MRKPPKTAKELILASITEDQVQASIVEYLTLKGATVLQTNLAKRHPVCDKGVPDLIVTHHNWPPGCWCGIEVKKPVGGKVSPEQQFLADEGRIFIVDSADDAYEAVKIFVRRMTMWTDGFSSPRRVDVEDPR